MAPLSSFFSCPARASKPRFSWRQPELGASTSSRRSSASSSCLPWGAGRAAHTPIPPPFSWPAPAEVHILRCEFGVVRRWHSGREACRLPERAARTPGRCALRSYGIGKGLWSTGRINKDLVSGFVIALTTSTTASTNVVFTKAAGGNEALALVNAVIGNLVGIFLTPAWMVAYLSASTGTIPYGKVIEQARGAPRHLPADTQALRVRLTSSAGTQALRAHKLCGHTSSACAQALRAHKLCRHTSSAGTQALRADKLCGQTSSAGTQALWTRRAAGLGTREWPAPAPCFLNLSGARALGLSSRQLVSCTVRWLRASDWAAVERHEGLRAAARRW